MGRDRQSVFTRSWLRDYVLWLPSPALFSNHLNLTIMCLLAIKGTPKVILKKDLTVYKAMRELNGQLSSIFQYMPYKRGVLVEADITQVDEGCGCCYEDQRIVEALLGAADPRDTMYKEVVDIYGRGIHAVLTKEGAGELTGGTDEHVVKCRIPAGAEVVFGLAGFIVTNKLIVL